VEAAFRHNLVGDFVYYLSNHYEQLLLPYAQEAFMATMRVVNIYEFGGSEVLRLESAFIPTPAEGEVLVKVHATSINPVDVKTRAGSAFAGKYKDQLPVVLGWDVSGVVEAVGTSVTEFKVGDELYGMPLFPDLAKTYADYLVAPANQLARKPQNLPHAEAAALPLVGLTAHQGLEAMNLQVGETLLVHAAAGGVGHVVVQLAKARGAKVICTASAKNLEFLKNLGADEVVDYTQTPFEQVVKKVNAVFDCVGGEVQARSFSVLRSGGRLVSILGKPSEELADKHGVKTFQILVKPDKAGLEHLTQLIEAGRVKPVVQEVFVLEDIAKAHDLVATGHVRGKVVVSLSS
jgi:NADPH:quinone reductase-like Zn-dependent oxidoreductase